MRNVCSVVHQRSPAKKWVIQSDAYVQMGCELIQIFNLSYFRFSLFPGHQHEHVCRRDADDDVKEVSRSKHSTCTQANFR